MQNLGLFHLGENAPDWLLARNDKLREDRDRVSPHTRGRQVSAMIAAKKRAAAKRKRLAAKKARRRHQYGTKSGNRGYRSLRT